MGEEHEDLHARDDAPRIGPTLEKARRDLGLSVEDVEEDTKIRRRYLEALERDDYGDLPGTVYTRGFLKTYANYLGLDGEALVREMRGSGHEPQPHPSAIAAEPEQAPDPPIRVNRQDLAGRKLAGRGFSVASVAGPVLALVLVVLLVGGLYYVGRQVIQASTGTSEVPTATRSEAPEGAARVEGEEGGAEQPPSGEQPAVDELPEAEDGDETTDGPSKLRMEVRVEGNISWLNVRTDGDVAYEQVAQPGFSRTFEAERAISVWSGNAGAVRIEVNGQDYGRLGDSGEVKTRDFTLKAAES